jgi:hypothetical protein
MRLDGDCGKVVCFIVMRYFFDHTNKLSRAIASSAGAPGSGDATGVAPDTTSISVRLGLVPR